MVVSKKYFIISVLIFSIIPFINIFAAVDSGGGATPSATFSGKLVKTTYDREENIQYFGIDTTGGSDPIIKNLPVKTTFSPSKNYDAYYKCNVYGSISSPSSADCTKTGDNSQEATKNDSTYNPATSSNSSSSSSTTTTTPKAPLGISLGKVTNEDTPEITATKGCNTKTNKYEKGLLNGLPCEGALKSLNGVLIFVKNILFVLLLPIAGVLFLIMFIVGGIIYITSAGNQTRVDMAKKTLTAAVIGLLIVILAYTIIAIFARILGGGVA